MKKKFLVFSMLLFTLCLFGCSLKNTPTKEVEALMSKYQSNDKSIIGELDDFIKTLDVDEDHYDSYKEVYLKQYQDLKYEIKDEVIDGDNATVTVQIDVYDYYKTTNDVNSYITNNPDEFNDNGVYSAIKGIEYKIKELTNTKDRVTYTININLTKVDNSWTIDNLNQEDLEKIHGTYAH